MLTVGMAGLGLAATPEQEIADKVPAALSILDTWQSKDPERAERKLHIVYWSPSDREPQPGARKRLTAILKDIQGFYAGQMKRLGFGPRTVGLDFSDDGLLNIHFVKGKKPYAAYQTNSGREIRMECLPSLEKAGLDANKETIVIFCNMANWDPEKSRVSQNSPYYAGGTHRNGTAWQVDSAILQIDGLAKKEPMVRDGQYGKISLGRYNSIFIGGICHELGHALGMPHNRERRDERKSFGTALMGQGNRSYGEERRGEGRGSFLTLAHALKLASHPMFCGSVKQMERPANAEIEGLKVELTKDGFRVSGKVTADPPPYAVIGYMDPDGGSDYDATTCTAIPDAEGKFSLDANALVPGKKARFRLVVFQANGACTTYVGARSRWQFPYAVSADGEVDLSGYHTMLMRAVIARVNAADAKGAAHELEQLRESVESVAVIAAATALVETLQDPPSKTPAQIGGEKLVLSRAKPSEAVVGWGLPMMDRLPAPETLISASGDLVARGIYAHAPARHRWDLGGKWQGFEGRAGLPDSSPHGSCVFVILADGRELWRSPLVKGSKTLPFKVDVSGAKELELRVEDGGDGNRSDWGFWFDPTLTSSK